MQEQILVTGATGLVGGELVRSLSAAGRPVRAAVRRVESSLPPTVETAFVKPLGPDTDWRAALAGVGAVVHCAGRVHIMKDSAANPLAEFRHINEAGTLTLARQAAEAGVRRFIFLSSILVNGDETTDKPFSADDPPQPASPYAISKNEAEIGLRCIARETGLEIVILRPPLVYGPNVAGNFQRLMKAVRRGVPLPLGAIKNKRSFVALDNLIDLICICIVHPQAAGQTFLVSDGEDLSTTDFIKRIGKAMRQHPILIPVPGYFLNVLGKCIGEEESVRKLTASLQVDIQKTIATLSWRPVMHVDEALARAVQAF